MAKRADPCDTCPRWWECNGIDQENCPRWGNEHKEEFKMNQYIGTKIVKAAPALRLDDDWMIVE